MSHYSHSSFFIVTNMSIHKNYVSHYSPCSFFIVINLKIWVYKGIIIHIVVFIVTNMSIHKKYVSYYSHCSFFIVTNFEIWVYKGMIIFFFWKLSWISFFEIWSFWILNQQSEVLYSLFLLFVPVEDYQNIWKLRCWSLAFTSSKAFLEKKEIWD